RLREETRKLPDLERVAARLGIGKLNPRQLAAMRDALVVGGRLHVLIQQAISPLLMQIARAYPDNSTLADK
ncbi:MAG: hypothetical protein PHU88_12755, partial [candidate division Zixibacteria bacterium]|nr:hypothetical protein [candidate division Zixibacteria bacterium]